jgi:O-antigen ligase
VLIWVMLGVLSVTWSEYKSLAITELRVKFIESSFFYLILRAASLTSRSSIRYCLYALISAGTIVSLVGIFQFVQGQAIITAEAGALRMASVYGSPNNLALFLGRCLPFVFAGILITSQIRYKILLTSIISIMGAAVILSQSAGALFIALPAAMAMVLLLSLKKNGLYTLLVFSVITILGIMVAIQSPRFSRLVDFSSGTNFYRLRVWESAIDMIQDYPITGIGLDQFLNKFRGEYIRPDAWQEPNLSHPHNIVLDFWLQLGISGVLVLIFIQYGFWKSVWQTYITNNNTMNTFHRILIIGAMGSMTNLITHGLIDNSVYVNDLVYIFMFLVAIAANEKSFQGRLINAANK